jgi:hypothetical protein
MVGASWWGVWSGPASFLAQQPKGSSGDRHGRGRKRLISSAARSAPSPAEPLAHQVLAGLAQHRIATTSQLRRMLRPDGTRQLMSRVLNRLRSDGFVDCTVRQTRTGPVPTPGTSRRRAHG